MTHELTADWASESQMHRPMLQLPAEGRLVSFSLSAPEISPSIFLQMAEGQERLFWQNGRDQVTLAGFGAAVQLMAWGAGRYREIRQKIESIFREAVLLGNQPDLAAPRFFGGFAFRDDFAPDNAWAVFHPAHFILPHYQFFGTAGEQWLTINALISEEEDLTNIRVQLQEALLARLDLLTHASGKDSGKSQSSADIRTTYPLTFEKWEENVLTAVSRIRSTDLEKVVLSRVCELRSDRRIDVCSALSYLNKNYKECTRFLFEPRPFHAFYGASPELLVQSNGSLVRSMALAGSIRRGESAAEDQILGHRLLNSQKDRHEHEVVVNSIRRRLEPFDVRLTIPAKPELYTLSYIHHLMTPIRGRLKQMTGVLPLLEALHPTPALGGSPRELALTLISEVEPVPRGWYAGPVGWVDANMDGQFAVGIRSAVAQDRRVWLYAGAGIVADSDPLKEWMETSLKFKPMLAALGLQTEPPSRAQIE